MRRRLPALSHEQSNCSVARHINGRISSADNRTNRSTTPLCLWLDPDCSMYGYPLSAAPPVCFAAFLGVVVPPSHRWVDDACVGLGRRASRGKSVLRCLTYTHTLPCASRWPTTTHFNPVLPFRPRNQSLLSRSHIAAATAAGCRRCRPHCVAIHVITPRTIHSIHTGGR